MPEWIPQFLRSRKGAALYQHACRAARVILHKITRLVSARAIPALMATLGCANL
jgi:hypothetical protein